jgi:hypothetical protein
MYDAGKYDPAGDFTPRNAAKSVCIGIADDAWPDAAADAGDASGDAYGTSGDAVPLSARDVPAV